jgi:hypothetical protein
MELADCRVEEQNLVMGIIVDEDRAYWKAHDEMVEHLRNAPPEVEKSVREKYVAEARTRHSQQESKLREKHEASVRRLEASGCSDVIGDLRTKQLEDCKNLRTAQESTLTFLAH